MEFKPKEEAKPGDAPAVNPFVNAFANIGAIMGRDLGVVALRAIEAERGNSNAICYWAFADIPPPIMAKVPGDLEVPRIHSAMLVPAGKAMPAFNFVDEPVQAMSVTVVDGSRLFVFVRPAAEKHKGHEDMGPASAFGQDD